MKLKVKSFIVAGTTEQPWTGTSALRAGAYPLHGTGASPSRKMATFQMGAEVVNPISSDLIQKLSNTIGVTDVVAKSVCLQHPRFKSKLTAAHFYVSFRYGGKVYAEDANSVEELDSLLLNDYFEGCDPLFESQEGSRPAMQM